MNMATLQYEPDYVIHPGVTLEEVLEERAMSQADLARRTGLSEKHISQVINGKASLSPDMAVRLEPVLGIRAATWNRLESGYQEARIRLRERSLSEDESTWLAALPIRELQKRGLLVDSKHKPTLLKAVREFFRVSNQSAWGIVAPLYRQCAEVKVDRPALATWMEIVRRRALSVNAATFGAIRFRELLLEIRSETASDRADIGSWLEQRCAAVGVRVVFEPEITGARVSGAAFWLNESSPVIALSLRGKHDDQVWFSFFHEAGHVLLHGGNKDRQWIDLLDDAGDDKELQADQFARDLLIPPDRLPTLLRRTSLAELKSFADDLGVSVGIVVGRWQRELGAFNKGYTLKREITFCDFDPNKSRWNVVRDS